MRIELVNWLRPKEDPLRCQKLAAQPIRKLSLDFLRSLKLTSLRSSFNFDTGTIIPTSRYLLVQCLGEYPPAPSRQEAGYGVPQRDPPAFSADASHQLQAVKVCSDNGCPACLLPASNKIPVQSMSSPFPKPPPRNLTSSSQTFVARSFSPRTYALSSARSSTTRGTKRSSKPTQ